MSDGPQAAYWRRTLRLFRDRTVRVTLGDGRERAGVLREGADGAIRVWTEDGVATIPPGLVTSCEQL